MPDPDRVGAKRNGFSHPGIPIPQAVLLVYTVAKAPAMGRSGAGIFAKCRLEHRTAFSIFHGMKARQFAPFGIGLSPRL
jgi:hypothetical protein